MHRTATQTRKPDRSLGLMACLALAAAGRAQAMRVLDRTDEPRPMLVTRDTDMSDVRLVDNNRSRPAVIVVGCSLTLGSATRDPWEDHERPDDPGIGEWFDGTFLPKASISVSHHDFDRAVVVGLGSVHIDVGEMECGTGVLLLARPNGAYGKESTVKIGSIRGHRYGVFASGQEDLTVEIGAADAALWPPKAGQSPGHTFYANESRLHGQYLRCKGLKVRIGSSRATAMAPGVRMDHVTAKFKGAWGVDYECLDDQNPCGAFDQYDSSGSVHVQWAHPGGDAQNPVFAAFRSGGGQFGSPVGKFRITGSYDCSLAPDASVPSLRYETKYARFDDATVVAKGPVVEWPGTDTSGLTVLRR